MPGSKDDDTRRQAARSGHHMVLDLSDVGVVKVNPEGADNADKSDLPVTCGGQQLVKFMAQAFRQASVHEQDQAIHAAMFAPTY